MPSGIVTMSASLWGWDLKRALGVYGEKQMVDLKGPIISINLESGFQDRVSEKTAVSLMAAATRLCRSYPSKEWGTAIEVIKVVPKNTSVRDYPAPPSYRYYDIKIILRNVASKASEPEKIEVFFSLDPHPRRTRATPRPPTNYRKFIHEFVRLGKENIASALEEELRRRRRELDRATEEWKGLLTPVKPEKETRSI